ncbi:MAG: polysaccharide biosynthesis/export family protein [Gemmatimonadota bacterium]
MAHLWRYRVKSSWFRLASLLIAAAVPLAPAGLAAQQRADTGTIEARRSMVTRAELQAAYEEIQRGLASTGYSQSLRSAKQAEATAIKERLNQGDLRSGDEIKVDVLGEPGLSSVYTVTPARTIALPGGREIDMHGILRSEVQDYLTTQFKAYIKDPLVTATASVRISIFGGVGHPGFYSVPANKLLSLVLQSEGGGVANNFRDDKSQILRNGVVVVDGKEFKDALYKGRTLEQLNIQAGDEIQIAVKPAGGLFWRIVGAVTGLSGLIYLFITISRG